MEQVKLVVNNGDDLPWYKVKKTPNKQIQDSHWEGAMPKMICLTGTEHDPFGALRNFLVGGLNPFENC